jgi:hypothetical protein
MGAADDLLISLLVMDEGMPCLECEVKHGTSITRTDRLLGCNLADSWTPGLIGVFTNDFYMAHL